MQLGPITRALSEFGLVCGDTYACAAGDPILCHSLFTLMSE
jgi:threonine dehydrogenase-like Zn-dependent dehydrogenase